MFANAWRLAATALVLGVAGFIPAHAGDQASGHGREGARHRWAEYLPNVEVVAQTGQKLRFYDDAVKGKIVVLSFIYTSCLDICPLITARLAQVYDALGEAAGRDVHFISISIDPENDTPERLKRHAEAFTSDARWLFLTGSKADIDLIRYKLGERSRRITEHGSHIMLFNDRTGEWLRDSAFADLGVLARTIRRMDPAHRDPIAVSAKAAAPAPRHVELPGQALFAKACASCHAIGKGDRVGPDLAWVTQRRDRAWLMSYIREPQAMRRSNDPTAAALVARFPNVRMPRLQMSERDVGDLLAYVDAQSFAVSAVDMKGPHVHATGIPAQPAGDETHKGAGHSRAHDHGGKPHRHQHKHH